ncbi:MAG TPA: hypothetical protein VE685_07950 [Thermoanaerobaculia bacterium]|nr:hypothetical protein [Thermoanaerobaculia bacterium]
MIDRQVPGAGIAKRYALRFAFLYFGLYMSPFLVSAIPFVDHLSAPYQKLLAAVVPWVGQRVFGVEIAYALSGSGDTMFDWVQAFTFMILAAAISAVWRLLARRGSDDARLREWLHVFLRFALATAMIIYGGMKAANSQFPPPSLDRLVQPIGTASPMGLLWTFMGASQAYATFTGLAELIGGLLLVARRTTLLGAVVCAATLSHVLMLNLCYDVPVKLFSFHLLALAVLLLVPDLRRLAGMFLFNRAVEPAGHRPLFTKVWLHRGALVLRTVFAVGLTGLILYSSWQGSQYWRDPALRSPLYGIWEVEELALNGEPRPPLLTDASRWRHVVFDSRRFVSVLPMDGSRVRYRLALDTTSRRLTLTKTGDSQWKSEISYQRPEPGLLLLNGTFDGQPLRARLRRDQREFLLVTRGFHWINERPFNR